MKTEDEIFEDLWNQVKIVDNSKLAENLCKQLAHWETVRNKFKGEEWNENARCTVDIIEAINDALGIELKFK